MNRKLPVVIIVMLLVAGLALIAYPHISKLLFDKQTKDKIDSFGTEHEYTELYEAFKTYNAELANGGQRYLNSESAYAEFPVDPAAYGAEGDMIGHIDIPSQDISLALYLGANEENLDKGAGIMGYTSAPVGGANTNCVIAGHNSWKGAVRFRNINRLQAGDKVYITNFWETRTYEVFDSRIIKPTDVAAVFIRPGEDVLTLMTCDSYGPDGPDRCVVYCRYVSE